MSQPSFALIEVFCDTEDVSGGTHSGKLLCSWL